MDRVSAIKIHYDYYQTVIVKLCVFKADQLDSPKKNSAFCMKTSYIMNK